MGDYNGFIRASLLTMLIGLAVYHTATALDGTHLLALTMTIMALGIMSFGGGKLNASQMLMSFIVIAGMVVSNFDEIRTVFNVIAGTSWFLVSTHPSSLVGFILLFAVVIVLGKLGAYHNFHMMHSTISMAATFGASLLLFGEGYRAIAAAAIIYIALSYPVWVQSSNRKQIREAA